MTSRKESYEEIAACHLRRTRPTEWAKMRPSEQTELVASMAHLAREHVAVLLPDRTSPPLLDETFEQAQARTETARAHLESEAIREFLLPAPPTGPTDPNEVERLEEEYRLGRPRPAA